MKKEILDKTGKKTGKSATLSDMVWALPMNRDLVTQAVNVYQFNQRKMTAETKTRGEVSGGGKKPWKQKGTGRARQGSIRSPLWRKGGIVFGPHLYKITKSLPKKMATLALKCVLSSRVEDMIIVDNIDAGKEKTTAAVVKMLAALGANKKKSLIVVSGNSKNIDNVRQGSRNIEKVKVLTPANVNIMDVLGSKCVILEPDAIKEIEERLS